MKRVVVTGGTGQIAYSLLFRIAAGEIWGDEPISLRVYDVEDMERALEGVAMELEDCAFPLLQELQVGSDLKQLSDGVDVAILVGAKPRGPGMQRADLLEENKGIFVHTGQALEDAADPNAKVLVVGNPCNTNCWITMQHAPKIPRKNFHAMMRLDQNRACALLARRAGARVHEVRNMTIWGNHSATQVPDYTHATIGSRKASEVIGDQAWLQGEFFDVVQKRGAAIIEARGKSSAASAAHGVIDALRALYLPTPDGEWFTSAMCSDGNPYGIEEGLVFGFPCRSRGDGEVEIVPQLEWDFFMKEKIAVTQAELIKERECVAHE